jgi:hypothetical protein
VEKSHRAKSNDAVDIATLLWVGGEAKITIVGAVFLHCPNARSTCLAKDLVLFYKCIAINDPKFEDRMLG